MTAPYPIHVTRWVCGGVGCSRSYAQRRAVEGHMVTCWRVPENRACHSCANFQILTCCRYASDECGCGGESEWTCAVDLPIAPGNPRVGCESWRSSEERREQEDE